MAVIPDRIVNQSALQWKIGLIIVGLLLILGAIFGEGNTGGVFVVGLLLTFIGGCIKTTKKLTRAQGRYR